MVSTRDEYGEIELNCPCCGALLKIDASLGKVIWHGKPPRKTDAPDIDHSAQLLEKKFQEALKRSQNEPIERPTREMDLD